MKPARLIMTLLAGLWVAGCGSDNKPANPDGGPTMAACTAYCTCMVMYCNSVVEPDGGTVNFTPGGTMSACVSTCLQHAEWDLACRTTHCNNVPMNGGTNDYKVIHCPHAVGMSNTCLPP
ncbi:MAG TPA: hypothetical protein VKN99_19855 [Polyangia bacterium]|nr:hypothetical protein [Polyangia bacterium]